MILSINQGGYKIRHWVSGKYTILRANFNTFFAWLDKFTGDRSTLNFVDEDITGARFTRLNINDHLTEFTAAAALRNIFTRNTCDFFSDRFLVSNFRTTYVRIQIIFTLHAINNNFQMQFTHP